MIQRLSLVATLAALIVLGHSRMSSAEPSSGVPGIWVFHVSITGSDPCECNQILTLHPDGSLDGPGTDRFSGPVRGLWSKSGSKVTVTFVENYFNKDGSAAGLYTIKGTLMLTGSTAGRGDSIFSLTSNAGKELASGAATFTANRLTLPPAESAAH